MRKKKWLALLVAALMAFTMIPAMSFAAETDTGEIGTTSTVDELTDFAEDENQKDASQPENAAMPTEEDNENENKDVTGSKIPDGVDTLQAGTYTVDEAMITLKNTITISGNVTINGNGTIKRDNSLTTYMFIVEKSGSLTLDGVTIDGGAVWENGDSSTTPGRGTTNNGIKAETAMIFNAGKLNIQGETTLQNNSNETGPAPGDPWGPTVGEDSVAPTLTPEGANSSGGAVLSVGQVTVSGGTIKGNQAYSGAGINSQGELTMTGGTITQNYARNYDAVYKYAQGGAIAVGGNPNWNEKKNDWQNGSFKTIISGGTIEKNAADGNGGGVAVFTCGLLEVTGGEGNGQSGPTIQNNVSNTGSGGGVYTWTAKGTINGGTIKENTAINGGGVSFTQSSTGTISGGAIQENTAKSGGGGVYVTSGTDANITGGTITKNKALYGGGAYLFDSKSTLTIAGNTFIKENTAKRAEGKATTPSGGGVYQTAGTLTVKGNAEIDDNIVDNSSNKIAYGGGIAVNAFQGDAVLNIQGGSISGNKVTNASDPRGGGVYIGNNTQTKQGSTVYNTIKLNMTGGTIGKKNNGNTLDNKEDTSSLFGAGLYVLNPSGGDEKTTVKITGGSISYNSINIDDGNLSGYGAGAAFLNKNNEISGKAEISHNVIVAKKASAGAGVYLANKAAVTMKGGSISENIVKMADGDMPKPDPQMGGGGVYVNNAEFTMNDGTIEKNVADGYWNGGGGVRVDNSGTFNMKDGEIKGNIACNSKAAATSSTKGGGAFYVHNGGIVKIAGGKITGNAGRYGGAITFINGPFKRGSVEITGGKITDNYCTGGSGGAIYMPSAAKKEGMTYEQTVEISGNPVIIGNKKGASISTAGDTYSITSDSATTEQNIYLENNSKTGDYAVDTDYADHQTLVLGNKLTGGAAIGVTTQTTPGSATNSAIPITSKNDDATEYYKGAAEYFIPDVKDVKSQENNNGKYVELAYDNAVSNQHRLTFNLQGVSISGSSVALFDPNKNVYTFVISPKAGYTLPTSIEASDIKVGENGEKPTVTIGTPTENGGGAQVTVSNVKNDAAITIKGKLKAPTVEKSDISKSYDGEAITLSVTPSHDAKVTYTYQWKDSDGKVIEGATEAAYTLEGENVKANGVNGDTYTCIVTAKDKDNNESEEVPVSVNVKITQSDIAYTATGVDTTYDGKAHGVTVDIPKGCNIQYSTDGINYSDDALDFTSAGEYTVYFKITSDDGNYKATTGSINVHIAKATQSMQFEKAAVEKNTNSSAFTNSLKATTVYGSVTYSSSNEGVATVDKDGKVTIKGAGETTITATAAGHEKNYDSATASYTLTVTKPGSNGGSGGGGSITLHTVLFMSDGAQTAMETILPGGKATEPAVPSKEGYTFEGWYTAGGTKFDFSTPITDSITLYAKWTKNDPAEPVITVGQVTGLTATAKTTTTLKLTFNKVNGADGYEIYDAVTNKCLATCTTQSGAEKLVKTITGLKPGETRKYKVRAYKLADGEKIYGDFSKVYTKATAEAKPVLIATAAKTSKTAIKIQWNKISGADGYIIYGSKCGDNVKKLKTITKGSTTRWTKKSLKAGKYYKYYVAAYKTVNGKKVTLATSSYIHATTTSAKYGNPTKIAVNKTSVTVAKGKTTTLKATVKKTTGKTVKEHCSKVRYKTSDKTVAAVTSAGKIKGVNKGVCKIYVYTQNGLYKTVKVTVK